LLSLLSLLLFDLLGADLHFWDGSHFGNYVGSAAEGFSQTPLMGHLELLSLFWKRLDTSTYGLTFCGQIDTSGTGELLKNTCHGSSSTSQPLLGMA